MVETLAALAEALARGQTTSTALVERALAATANPEGEGARAFLSVAAGRARSEAEHWDRERRAGRDVPRYAGIPFSVKDLFDVEGEVTRAGSKLLAGSPPARADALAIGRLRRAGLIALGRTNMTEFAYSGVGLNPHYGTPRSAYDRATGRSPGGSSSGAAVSVADGMVPLAIGSDTGGSCRIPAAYNGIVGYKPSSARVPLMGAFPLSPSFDTIGPLANTVACCAAADAIMAGDWDGVIAGSDLAQLRVGVLRNVVLDGLDDEVARDFGRILRLGSRFSDVVFRDVEELPQINRNGGIVAAEAWEIHQPAVAAHGDQYDPRVAGRMRFGGENSATDMIRARTRRAEMKVAFGRLMQDFDVLMMPTVMNVPPPLSAFVLDADYMRLNAKSLRNTYLINFLDGCAISLPMNRPGAPVTGLMLAAPHGRDQELFAAAAAFEAAISLMWA